MITLSKIIRTSPKLLIPTGLILVLSGSLIVNALFTKAEILPNIIVREIQKLSTQQTNKVIDIITTSDKMSSVQNETSIAQIFESSKTTKSLAAISQLTTESLETELVLVPGYTETFYVDRVKNIQNSTVSSPTQAGGVSITTSTGGSGAIPKPVTQTNSATSINNGPTATYNPGPSGSNSSGGPRPSSSRPTSSTTPTSSSAPSSTAPISSLTPTPVATTSSII